MLPPAEQQTVADALESDAEVMSNTQLEEQLAGQPEAIQDEIIRINTDARPLALQVALLIPALAGLLGLRPLVPHDAPPGSHAVGVHRRAWRSADRSRSGRLLPPRMWQEVDAAF